MGIPIVATSVGQGIGDSQNLGVQSEDCCPDPATADAGADSNVCSSNPVSLNGSVGGSATSGTWTGGLGVFNPSITSLNATYTPTAAEIANGSITLTLTTDDPTGPCVSSSDAVTYTFDAPLVVDAGSDDILCSDLTTIALNGSISGSITTGEWSGGAGTYNPNAQALNAIYTPTPSEIAGGTIALVLTSDDPLGPCDAEFDAVVYTLENALTVDAGADFTTCSSVAIPLNGSVSGAALSYTWTGGGTFSPDASTLNATYTPSATEITNGSATLTLTSNPSSAACSVESDQVMITLADELTADVGTPTLDCVTKAFTLDGSITGTTIASWTGGAGTFSPNRNTLNAVYTPTSGEIASGSVDLTLTASDPSGSCASVSSSLTLSYYNAVTANLTTATICAGNDLVVPGNPSGGSGNYTSHTWALGSGTTSTGVVLTNDNTENVTLNANTQGAVYLEYTVTDDQGCSATATTIINILYSPMCSIDGPMVSCPGDNITLEYVPTEFATSPPLGSVVTGSQGQIETHTITGITSPDDAAVVLTLPTWDDSFYETTLNGNVVFPASNEPQSWGAGGLNIASPWTANVNGLPRTIITFTSTSVTYQVSQNVNSTTMTTVVPTNWVTTPQPFQVGSNTLVFGIKNTFGPTSGSWSIQTFQDYDVSYLWSTGSTEPSIDVSPTTTTTYQVTVSNGSGCSRVCSHTVTIEDIADAGNDVSICNGGSIIIGQAPESGVNYNWSPTTGLSDPNIANPVASPTSTTNYTLTATSVAAGCVMTDDVTVTVGSGVGSNVVDQNICIGQVTNIDGLPVNGSGVFGNHTWQVISATATGYILSDTDQQVVSFNASNASPGQVVLRYSVDDTNGCGTASEDITLTLGPDVQFAGPGILCEDAGIQTLSATPIGGTFSGLGVSGNTFNPTIAGVGQHILTYTYSNGSGCTVSKSSVVLVQALPCINQNCTVVISDNFDTPSGLDFGNWNDGGGDCAKSGQFAYSGNRSVRLRDNSGVGSSMTTNDLDMSSYDEASIEFTFYPRSFETGEDFFLEMSLDGGTSFSIVRTWVVGTDFTNNVREFESVSLTGYTFTANTQFRLRADASNNGDQIYIDDVVVQGCTNVPPDVCTLVSFVGGLTTSGDENTLGTLSVNLEIPSPLTTDISIDYYTLNGTATSPSDYGQVVSGTAVILAGETSTSAGGTPVQVVINGDTDNENDENFEIIIPSSSAICANPDSILTVTIINDDNSAPILTNIENDNLLYCPASGGSTIVTQTITVDEPEGDNLSATVTLTGTTDPAADILSVNLSAYPSATATYSYPTLTIVGTIPPADMQNILRSVEFTTNSSTMGVRSIQIVIHDGTQDSNVGTRNINSDETAGGCCNAAAPSIGK